jgi:cytochrome c oxidase assembly protein Cox11
MFIFSLVFFFILFLVLGFSTLTLYKFLTKGPDFGALEISGSVNELIQTLVNEINTALSLNQTEVIHKFNPVEPPIDGEVAANVTFKVAQAVPCVILFYYEPNHDVRIVLQRMTQGS